MNPTRPLNELDVITSSKDNIVSDMGAEKVMLSVKTGNYYNLGHIGGRIWDAIAEPIAIAGLIDRMMEEFEVERSLCAEHVFSFLEHLKKEGLILVHSKNPSTAGA